MNIILSKNYLKKNFESIPQISRTDKVKLNLTDMGFEVVTISIMYKKVNGTRIDLPIILVQLTKTDQNTNI